MEGGSRTDPSTPMIHKMIQWMIGIVLRSGGVCVCVCEFQNRTTQNSGAQAGASPAGGCVNVRFVWVRSWVAYLLFCVWLCA